MKTFFYCDIIQIESHDTAYSLSLLEKYKIEVHQVIKFDKYHLQFITSSKNRAKVFDAFKSAKVVNSIGLANIIKNTIFKVTTLLCLLLSLCTFYLLNQRIIDVQVQGDANRLNEVVLKELKNHQIDKFAKKKEPNELKIVEREVAKTLYQQIEWLELRQVGVVVKAKFLKRRNAIEEVEKKDGLYATKDGLIRYFKVMYGVKQVSEYQYVTKGTLLISDTIITTKDQIIVTGAYGSVYANTWYLLSSSITVEEKYQEIEVFLTLYEMIKRQIDYELDGDDEYIEDESIIKFEIKEGFATLKVHYTLLEDITR